MITDAEIRKQGYIYFLEEAPELIQIIEQELFSLSEGYSTAKVHNLMRATHTIKGGAATVGLEAIQFIAHSLEDVFKALYNPDVVIDDELQTLLIQAYECLLLAINSELTGSKVNEEEFIGRANSIFAQLQDKLGDAFGSEAHIPTSQELGFDIVQSIFEVGVKQRIDSIAKAINNPPDTNHEFVDFLASETEVFLGLGESLNLPGFKELAQTILIALQANPHQVQQIAEIALADLLQAHATVMAGDRTSGGAPSPALQKLTLVVSSASSDAKSVNLCNTTSLENITTEFLDIEKSFYEFLTESGNSKNERINPTTAKLYLKVIRYILGWFNHFREVPASQLNLEMLISHNDEVNQLNYLEEWLTQFLDFIREDEDSYSLCLYRQGVILIILLAVVKFQSSTRRKDDVAISLVQSLQNQISQLAKEYKQYPPVTAQEKNWLDSPKLQTLLVTKEVAVTQPFVEDNLIESIWGGEANHHIADEVANPQIEEPVKTDNSSEKLAVTEKIIADTSLKFNEPVEDKSLAVKNKNSRQRSFIRVDVDELQRINYLAGELLIYQKRRNLYDDNLQELIDKLSQQLIRHQETLNQLRDLPLQRQNFTLQYTKNVASVKFDSLEMDDYSEFHISLHEAIEEALQLQETTESLDLLLKQATQISEKKQSLTFGIIDNLVSARMMPLANVLDRFPQMVQKLGNVYNKRVELKLNGTNVLVDKAIAEKLYDPLLHLVRNAFDHGIEPPQVRREAGKPEQGVIEICAYHQGSQTIIEVRDDGQGLNLESIYKKAIELNFIPANDAARGYYSHSSEAELLDLMFAPGLSTAEKVNEISGRGMGLDIVRSQLQSLNGSISVQSWANRGTTFILKIPFSMTTDQLMLVQAGGVIYALLLENIERILIPAEQQIKEVKDKKILHCNIGNEENMVILHKFSELMKNENLFFSSASLQNPLANQEVGLTKNPIVLLRRNQGIFALEVDQIIGEQELVIRPLGNAIAPPKYVYGCSSLANGNLILVIDGALLLESIEMQASLDIPSLPSADTANQNALPMSGYAFASTPLLAASRETQPNQSPEPVNNLVKVVLVVDDAISLRQTLSLTLQKAGYQVMQAQNGIEALEQLQHHPEIQVIISDLEMPHMNGFELLSNIIQNPKLAKIPVAILSSRSAEKHRQLAKELGAKAYLTKPYLEPELLSTVGDLINRFPKTGENSTSLAMMSNS